MRCRQTGLQDPRDLGGGGGDGGGVGGGGGDGGGGGVGGGTESTWRCSD